MYFQARSHVSIPVADAAAAVAVIEGPTYCSNQCPVWTNANGHRIALVPDGHIDNVTMEMAVVNLDTKEQVESLTFAWMKDTAEKIAYVKECENGTEFAQRVSLCIDGQGGDALVNFECSCCGTGFKSTIAEQAPRDQDAGFGHCPACIDRFGTKLAA